MKTFTKFLTMLAVAALFATGCVNEARKLYEGRTGCFTE